MPLYALAHRLAMQWLQDACGENGIVMAWADDTYVLAPIDEIGNILQQAPAALFGKTGLTLNVDKTEILEAYQQDATTARRTNADWVQATRPQPVLNVVHQRLESQNIPSSIATAKSAIKVAGVPIGKDEAAQDLVEETIRKHKSLTSFIPKISEAGFPHAALRALQVCGVRRYQHIQRGCSLGVAKNILGAADTLVLDTFCKILEMNEHDESCQVYDEAVKRTRLSTRYGGMQLPCMADELHICNYSGYAAAVHDTWLRCKQFSQNIPTQNAVRLMESMPEDSEWAANARTSL